MRVTRLLLQLALTMLPGLATGRALPAQDAPAMVVLVRHAEKATVGGNDPSLSEAGHTRAIALAAALKDAGVSVVLTTTFKRTSETGEAVATPRNLQLERIPIAGTTTAHVEAMVAAIRKHPGEVVLVVGHSNTIPAIVTALGGPKLPDLCDANYATMFVMQTGKAGTAPHVLRTRYGASEPEGAETCTTPMK